MVKLWFSCAWHCLDGAQYWFNCGSVVFVAWLGCGGLVFQVVVQVGVTLFRCYSVVCGMVQMWFRCVWSSVVGCG